MVVCLPLSPASLGLVPACCYSLPIMLEGTAAALHPLFLFRYRLFFGRPEAQALLPGQDVGTTLKRIRHMQTSFTLSSVREPSIAAGAPGAGPLPVTQLRSGSAASLKGRPSGDRQWLGQELRVGSTTTALPSGGSRTGSITAPRLGPRMGSITEGHAHGSFDASDKLPCTPAAAPPVPRMHSVTSVTTSMSALGAAAAPFRRLSLTSPSHNASPYINGGSGNYHPQQHPSSPSSSMGGGIQPAGLSCTAAAASTPLWSAAGEDHASSPISSAAPNAAAPLPIRRWVGAALCTCTMHTAMHPFFLLSLVLARNNRKCPHSFCVLNSLPLCRSLQTRLSSTMSALGSQPGAVAAAARDAALGSFLHPSTPARRQLSVSQVASPLGPRIQDNQSQWSPMWPNSPPVNMKGGGANPQGGAGVLGVAQGVVVQRTASMRLPPRTPSRTLLGGSSRSLLSPPAAAAAVRAPSISSRLSAGWEDTQGSAQQQAAGDRDGRSSAPLAGAPSFRRLTSSRMSLSRMRMVLQSYEVRWGAV